MKLFLRNEQKLERIRLAHHGFPRQMSKNKETTTLTTHFLCSGFGEMMEETVDSIERWGDEVETVNRFLVFGRQATRNANGGCKVAVTTRVRISWV